MVGVLNSYMGHAVVDVAACDSYVGHSVMVLIWDSYAMVPVV